MVLLKLLGMHNASGFRFTLSSVSSVLGLCLYIQALRYSKGIFILKKEVSMAFRCYMYTARRAEKLT